MLKWYRRSHNKGKVLFNFIMFVGILKFTQTAIKRGVSGEHKHLCGVP